MGATLTHLLRADTQATSPADQTESPPLDKVTDHVDHSRTGREQETGTIRPGRLTEAATAAALINASGRRISSRALRTAGVHGSNADLGALARIIRSQPTSKTAPDDPWVPKTLSTSCDQPVFVDKTSESVVSADPDLI